MHTYRLVFAVLVVVLTGCSPVDVFVDEDLDASASVEGLRVHRSNPGSGMDAIVTGIVEVDPTAGCVWLSDSSGARYPVVWPGGTAAQLDPFEITLADGQMVRPGDRVAGGGGYVKAESVAQGLGLEPFPSACVQVGDAAVFNADSPISVTPGVGLELAETLVDRFSPPVPIGLELVAVNANARSVAVIDFVTGTVHRYEPGQYVAPQDAIDGASGGGGFIHLWADGTIHSYPGRLDADPLVYEPDLLRRTPGIASSLEVLPAPDGEHTWLVQPGAGDETTLVELINLVEVRVTRLVSAELERSWQPVGATTEGVVLVTDDPEPITILVANDGMVRTELQGVALSVGWNGVAILRPNGSLIITDALLRSPIEVEKPSDGNWGSVGGPIVPATSPPTVTGAGRFLVVLADGTLNGPLSGGDLIMVDSAGIAVPIYQLSSGSHLASWSRGEDWVVVVEDSLVTLVPLDEGSSWPLGALVPDSHWVLTAG